MSPDGMPPNRDPLADIPTFPTFPSETELAAYSVFAVNHKCMVKEVDALIENNPALQADLDTIMDFVARDELTDDCPIGVIDTTFLHLSDSGLINARRVKVVAGVGVSTHRPFHRESAASRRGRAIAAKGR